jgi:ArsR family transcriptional regulator
LYIPLLVYTYIGMKLLKIYQCLCDQTRLRILNLLAGGDLCVCHIQSVLGEPQVKVSKHLAYLKARGMVASRRKANWMVYSLPGAKTRELAANLACLQDCTREDPVFKSDRSRLRELKCSFDESSPECCRPASREAKRTKAAAK